MNKYSDIEIQTAKNLLKEGYKWIARSKSGRLFVYPVKPHKADAVWYPMENCCYVCKEFVPIFQSVRFGDKEPTYIEDIVNPQILDESERQYLSAVIKPFRDRVDFICKENAIEHYGTQRIGIAFTDESMYMALPFFKSGTMYKGMELGNQYTLEELGL